MPLTNVPLWDSAPAFIHSIWTWFSDRVSGYFTTKLQEAKGFVLADLQVVAETVLSFSVKMVIKGGNGERKVLVCLPITEEVSMQ